MGHEFAMAVPTDAELWSARAMIDQKHNDLVWKCARLNLGLTCWIVFLNFNGLLNDHENHCKLQIDNTNTKLTYELDNVPSKHKELLIPR